MIENCKSKEYSLLENRISEITDHFTSKFFKSDADPESLTPEQEDMFRGFVLLCHAEIEDYFESVAIRLLYEAEKTWIETSIANYNLASLFIEHEKIEKLNENNKPKSTSDKSKQIINEYRKSVVERNHGIKENDINNLFSPLGYLVSEFDSTFVLELSSFGELRGKIAHTSSQKTAKQLLDPKTVIKKIEQIVKWIANFENEIQSKSPRFFEVSISNLNSSDELSTETVNIEPDNSYPLPV